MSDLLSTEAPYYVTYIELTILVSNLRQYYQTYIIRWPLNNATHILACDD